MPFGPPQNGIDGLTFEASAGSSLTSAKSLPQQVPSLLSFAAFMAFHEL
jgi:hypothetical protein